MAIHLIAYAANSEQRIARVLSPRTRPSWSEVREQYPDFRGSGTYLGVEPQYTLTYTTPGGPATKTASGSKGVETIGALLVRAADRGEAWGIQVLDEGGADVTFNFACFN
ncbi:hypothetical protein [Streptomyces sp. 891-h]|uniref:hypothetical protein n=1 Tax=Streptomyces sp. 891-h TaxID=2720714 RepID=UPI001FAABDC1|nr:hypothetical protein [Streptomyces sp. 891-h]UNZ20640.1 hypothetical protein HC362_29815 [Streptomyces sp. 891-h]